ncbi:hypothetical protein RSSM_02754 [Rhodopirellula sallentina SM41]|uniref:Uncharacterized protein n=1 Tax=Rhodopirellula sallentina SM41 TaxID=1263870 RepID=M5UIF7_9BACT|nr:hypothetical protein RSSM_02754 [Rhodopirellula sallentina SM41]
MERKCGRGTQVVRSRSGLSRDGRVAKGGDGASDSVTSHFA